MFLGQSIQKWAGHISDLLPDKDGVENQCVVVILSERDDKATVGELEAATARHLNRWTDEVCGKGAVRGENCDVELESISALSHQISPPLKKLNLFYLHEMLMYIKNIFKMLFRC